MKWNVTQRKDELTFPAYHNVFVFCIFPMYYYLIKERLSYLEEMMLYNTQYSWNFMSDIIGWYK